MADDPETRIFEVDDGSTWWFAAVDRHDARRRWLQACIEIYGNKSEADVLEDYGEPEILPVVWATAAKIKIKDDDHMAPCPTCGTPNKAYAKRSLLDVWLEDRAKPPERRARCGALANSEWP